MSLSDKRRRWMQACAFAVLALVAVASAQPFLPGQNLLPAGNLRTTDGSGPNDGSFNLTLLTTQENQLKGEPPQPVHQSFAPRSCLCSANVQSAVQVLHCLCSAPSRVHCPC